VRSYTTYVPSFYQKAITLVVCILAALLFFPHCIFAASLSLIPSSGTHAVGSTFSVGVYVGSSNKAMNAASGVLSFSKEILEVISVSKNQSVISLWVQEPSFSNSAGTVNYEGIVLNPGYTGAAGKVATINFRVKAEGTATVSFSSGSVLANDGSGTEILGTKGSARFTLSPKPAAEQVTVSESVALSTPAPKVSSVTHKEGLWSNSATGKFTFAPTEGTTAMRLLLDDQPTSIPTVVYQPPVFEREIIDIDAGVWYLHVQYKTAEGWGEIAHYKLQVDTVLPVNLTVTKIDTSTTTTNIATFSIAAEDVHSGIVRYELTIDGGEPVTLEGGKTVSYTTPHGLVAGAHTMLVRAFDGAGNEVSTSIQFITRGQSEVTDAKSTQRTPEQSTFLKTGATLITVLSIVVPFVALVLLLLVLLYSVWKAYGGLRKKITKDVLDAKMVVHKAFALLRDDIAVDIETLKKASAKRKLTREEARILKRLQQNIAEAERVIASEMTVIADEVQ
jgi:hypothetical protein